MPVSLAIAMLVVLTAIAARPSTTSSSTSSLSSSEGQHAYTIVRQNVSVPLAVTSGASCLWNLPCAVYNSSVDFGCCVTLIMYQGSFYYLYQERFEGNTYAAWLTNSTVYCATPSAGARAECPA